MKHWHYFSPWIVALVILNRITDWVLKKRVYLSMVNKISRCSDVHQVVEIYTMWTGLNEKSYQYTLDRLDGFIAALKAQNMNHKEIRNVLNRPDMLKALVQGEAKF